MPISRFELRVGWNQDFNPFLGMDRLRKPRVRSEVGRSSNFNLEGVGRGFVNLTKDDDVMRGHAHLIDVSSRPPRITTLNSGLAVINVEFFQFDPGLKEQPDFLSIIRVGHNQAIAVNENAGESTEDSGLFLAYGVNRRYTSDLVTPISLKALQQLVFRFERLSIV